MTTTLPLTVRDVKNRVLAALPENERNDALVGEARETGGYIILTDYRVFEIYSAIGEIYIQVRALVNTGFEDVRINADGSVDL